LADNIVNIFKTLIICELNFAFVQRWKRKGCQECKFYINSFKQIRIMNRLMIALVVLLSITACKKDIEYQTSFKKSKQTWHKFKASSNNSYRFEVVDAS